MTLALKFNIFSFRKQFILINKIKFNHITELHYSTILTLCDMESYAYKISLRASPI